MVADILEINTSIFGIDITDKSVDMTPDGLFLDASISPQSIEKHIIFNRFLE